MSKRVKEDEFLRRLLLAQAQLSKAQLAKAPITSQQQAQLAQTPITSQQQVQLGKAHIQQQVNNISDDQALPYKSITMIWYRMPTSTLRHNELSTIKTINFSYMKYSMIYCLYKKYSSKRRKEQRKKLRLGGKTFARKAGNPQRAP